MSLASGSIDLKSLKVAGEGASKYITEINNGGITIHDSQNIDVDYAVINSKGMAIFHGDDIPVAQFGDDVRIGKEDDAHIELNNYGMTAISSEGTPYFKVSASGASFIEAVKQPVAIKTYDDELFSRQNTWAMSEIVSSDVWDSLNDGDEFYCTFWGILHDKSDDGRTVYPTEKTYFLRTKQFIKGTTKSYTEETSYGFRVGYSATNNAIAMTLNYQTSPPLYYIKSLCCQFYINEVRAAPCYAIGANMMDFGDPFAITFGDGTLPSAYGVSLGRYNIDDENNNNVFTIGNGTDPENRANAFTIDWNGNVNASGQYENLYKITTVPIETGTVAAGDYKGATTYSMTAQSGYNAVGIVGWSTGNWRIQPTSHYVSSNSALYAGFANYGGTSASTTITFRILWLKATES